MDLIVCGPEDLDVLTSLYAQAVKYLESHVNYPKWHSDYPCRDSIRSCIQAGTQFICTENGCPVGAVVLNEEPGGRYEAVSWASSLRQGEYLVLHTLAVSPACYGQGIGSKMVALCIQYARKNGYKAIRLDVVPGNVPAIRLYEKMGFTYAGTADLLRGIEDIPLFDLYEMNL